MSEFLKSIGATALLFSIIGTCFLGICKLIEWYFTWALSIFPLKNNLMPFLLVHAFVFGVLIFLLGSLIELICKRKNKK